MSFDPYSAFAEVRTKQELSDALKAMGEKLGFPLFTFILVCLRGGEAQKQFVFANTPPAFFEASFDPGNSRRDPVLKRLRTTTMPFVYDQALYVSENAGALWEEQAPYGYRNGIAVAQHLAGGRRALLGYDRHETVNRSDRATTVMLGELTLTTIAAAQAAERLLTKELASIPSTNELLTIRQRLCLYWSARGLTDTDIGSVLGLTRRTVERDIQTAMLTFYVGNRTHAVAEAMKLDLLDEHLADIKLDSNRKTVNGIL